MIFEANALQTRCSSAPAAFATHRARQRQQRSRSDDTGVLPGARPHSFVGASVGFKFAARWGTRQVYAVTVA